MSQMNIAERRIPQDGRIRMKLIMYIMISVFHLYQLFMEKKSLFVFLIIRQDNLAFLN